MTKSRTTQTTKQAMEKRIAKLERYRARHVGDLKKITTGSYYSLTSTGQVYYLSGCATGDTYDDRTGLVINVQKLQLGLNFQCVKTANVRVIILSDKFQAGTPPTPAEILAVVDVTSPLNYFTTVTQKRLRIIYDKTHSFSLNGTLTAVERKDINLPLRIRYVDNTALTASAGANSLYALILADTTSAGDIGFTSRVLFTDE